MIDSLGQVLTNASSGLSSQSIRMNTIASNLANAGSKGPTEEGTYHKKFPIFNEVRQSVPGLNKEDQPIGGVRVSEIKHGNKPLERRHDPDNPNADADGYVYVTDVNPITEMTDMIAASREYEANVEVMNTTKNLMVQSLNIIRE